MAAYTYFFTDLLTNAPIGRLPLSNVAVTTSLSAVGQFSAELDLADSRVRAAVDLSSKIIPGRTAYWVDRNGILIAGGIVWDDEYISETRKYLITGATFDSYLDHVQIQQFLNYTGVDLCTIAIDLWNKAQGGIDGSNIGVIIPPSGSVLSGVLDTETYDPSTYTKYGQAVQQLSQQSPGFDYYIALGYDVNLNPTKTLILGSPYVGQPSSTTGLVFRKPGNILNYRWPRFGSQSPNTVLGVGGGIGVSQFQSSYINTAMIAGGYPITVETIQYKNVYDQSVMNKLTTAYGQAVSPGVFTPSLILNPDDVRNPLGSYNVGDSLRVIIDPDEFFATGMDTHVRISSITINPSDAGNEEKIVMTLSQAVT